MGQLFFQKLTHKLSKNYSDPEIETPAHYSKLQENPGINRESMRPNQGFLRPTDMLLQLLCD